jgi:amino acid permease
MVSPPQESPRGTPQTPRALWFWWLILLVLLVWNAMGNVLDLLIRVLDWLRTFITIYE